MHNRAVGPGNTSKQTPMTSAVKSQEMPSAINSGPAHRAVRLAIVGCGTVVREFHLPVLAGHDRIQLAALVDPNLSRAKELASPYGITQVVADFQELDRKEIDAAIIATPPSYHSSCAIALMKRGIHVLVEKPLALDLAQAQIMVKAAEEAGVVLSVGAFRRLLPC